LTFDVKVVELFDHRNAVPKENTTKSIVNLVIFP